MARPRSHPPHGFRDSLDIAVIEAVPGEAEDLFMQLKESYATLSEELIQRKYKHGGQAREKMVLTAQEYLHPGQPTKIILDEIGAMVERMKSEG